MIEAEWWDHDSADDLADAVASDVGFIIGQALEARGEALVALPGGKSPLAAFERLAQAKLDWARVTILPTDDRLVPEEDPLSNSALLKREFGPLGSNVVALTGSANGHHAAGAAAAGKLAELRWPPDLVWLGMGADGHTASIFPGPDLKAALDAPKGRRAVGVMPDPLPPEAPVARVTLTRSAIASARTLIVTLSGAEKRQVLDRALREADLSTFPIGRVLAAADKPIDIHWSRQ